jgi:hypothetical protein
MWPEIFNLIKQDGLREAFQESSRSVTPVHVSKLGNYLQTYIHWRTRRITLMWWCMAIIEDTLQAAGISPYVSMKLPWRDVLIEVGHPIDSIKQQNEAEWTSVTSNVACLRASIRNAPILPKTKASLGSKYEGAEFAAIVQWRYIESLSHEVKWNCPVHTRTFINARS